MMGAKSLVPRRQPLTGGSVSAGAAEIQARGEHPARYAEDFAEVLALHIQASHLRGVRSAHRRAPDRLMSGLGHVRSSQCGCLNGASAPKSRRSRNGAGTRQVPPDFLRERSEVECHQEKLLATIRKMSATSLTPVPPDRRRAACSPRQGLYSARSRTRRSSYSLARSRPNMPRPQGWLRAGELALFHGAAHAGLPITAGRPLAGPQDRSSGAVGPVPSMSR
jgi:hypothetical protein